MVTTATWLAGLIAIGIIGIGIRFLLRPVAAAQGYGVPVPMNAYLTVKGVRDITAGLVMLPALATGNQHILGWPRVIADEIWAKLLWAGLNLDSGDLPQTKAGHFSPIELVRAITVTWLFSGLRSDEIARLRVRCVRWQHDDVPISGDSDQVLARDAVCLLDVPTHKTGTAFTKPVDPILGQAIEAWQADPDGRTTVYKATTSLTPGSCSAPGYQPVGVRGGRGRHPATAWTRGLSGSRAPA